jgi:hypothetical protein
LEKLRKAEFLAGYDDNTLQ